MGRTAPRQFTLEDLATLVNDAARPFDIRLSKTSTWIDWEASSIFVHGDARIIGVEPSEKWPLRISFTGTGSDAQAAPFDPAMEFYCQSKTTAGLKKPGQAA